MGKSERGGAAQAYKAKANDISYARLVRSWWKKDKNKTRQTDNGRKRGTMSGCIYCDGTRIKCAQAFAAPELRSELRSVVLPLGSTKVKRGGPAETLR